MKLLCATDGSRPSEKAVAYAVDIAKKLKAHLTFLTVTTVSAERAAKTYFWDEQTLAAGDAMIHQELSAAAAMAKQAGLDEVRCVTVVGRDIAEAIVGYGEANGFDQIIAGSSGRTGAARLLLGSVAGAVVAKAHCPVTIVR